MSVQRHVSTNDIFPSHTRLFAPKCRLSSPCCRMTSYTSCLFLVTLSLSPCIVHWSCLPTWTQISPTSIMMLLVSDDFASGRGGVKASRYWYCSRHNVTMAVT